MDLLLPIAQATGDEPAGGAAVAEALGASAGAIVATVLIALLIAGHRSGRIGFLAAAAQAAERQSGLPGWAALPSAVVGVSLLVGVLGMYWTSRCTSTTGVTPGPWPIPRTT